ncbi:hypothetical protein GH714_025056 [Hevea brasiliensis]|uniref:Major facilitator superfamily (MFS) profile domain-containing protein n=1 Tax=Hevea brasiliensis TaxID=3981 RepID=A0A6A6M3Q8_HEVBR|nr:hypothetical protein GH714_025056 [Hevea brasiliensis]
MVLFSSLQYSFFGSVLTIGGIVGAASCGKIADLVGRRGAIWVSNALYIGGLVAIALSKSAWSLDLGRLLMGVGIGILAYVVPVYIAEITPKNFRGAFVSLIMVHVTNAEYELSMTGCGISVTYVIGSVCDWRILALLGTIPCLIQLLGAFFISESPRWLAKVGREKELEVALKLLRGKNADVSHEAAEITEYTEHLDQLAEDGIKELFQQKYACVVIVGVGLMALLQFGGLNGYAYYMNSTLESAGISSGVGSVAASVVRIIMNICGLFLVDKSGRRPLFLVSSIGVCLGSFITGLSFLLQGFHLGKEITPSLALAGILLDHKLLNKQLSKSHAGFLCLIFPVNIKDRAGSLVNLVSSVGSWIVAYTFNFLFEWSSAGVFFIYAIIAGLGVVFIAKLVPETKGRTLEEIQASILTQ